MNDEHLGDALERIARGAASAHDARADAGAGIDVAATRADARRRRTRFDAVAGVAAAAVVGVLALGGAALARGDRTPEPPAQTPPAAGVTCGTVLDELPRPDEGHVALVTLDLDSTDVALGEPVEGTVTLTAGDDVDLAAGTAVQLALVRDGVVVGMPAEAWGMSTEVREVAMPIGACEPSATGSVLPAGEYSVVAVALGLWLESGDPWPYVLVSRPVTVDVADADPRAASSLPACGEPAQGLAPTVGAVTPVAGVQVGVVDPGTGAFRHEGHGDALHVTVALGNYGSDLFDALGVQLEMVVTGNGVVVASWGGDHADPPPEDWRAGTGRATDAVTTVSRCGADAEPLGPGDYVLWVRATTSAADAPGAQRRPIVVVAPPVPFTVDDADDPDPSGPVTFVPEHDAGWTGVDPASVPGGVAFTQDPRDQVVDSQASEDGRRWRLAVAYEGGRDTYERARAAVVEAGFEVVLEESDPARPFWSYGQFRRDDLLLVVDVSNETGGGFFGSWLVVRTG